MRTSWIVLGIAIGCASLAQADQILIDFESYPTGPIANGYNG